MEVVINYEYLKGKQDEVVIKENSIAAKNVLHTLHFRSPYGIFSQGSGVNGLNCDDGIIPYNELETALSEAVSGYAHLYSYGVSKYRLLSGIVGRPVFNLEVFLFPSRLKLSPRYSCVLPYQVIMISVVQHETRIPTTSG